MGAGAGAGWTREGGAWTCEGGAWTCEDGAWTREGGVGTREGDPRTRAPDAGGRPVRLLAGRCHVDASRARYLTRRGNIGSPDRFFLSFRCHALRPRFSVPVECPHPSHACWPPGACRHRRRRRGGDGLRRLSARSGQRRRRARRRRGGAGALGGRHAPISPGSRSPRPPSTRRTCPASPTSRRAGRRRAAVAPRPAAR